jgi:hypothetical protein
MISAHDQEYSAHQTKDRLLALPNLYMELRQLTRETESSLHTKPRTKTISARDQE